MKEYNLEIKKDFKELLLSLSKDEFKLLEENILENGIQDKIIVGVIDNKKYIIDGHNRYTIAKKYNLGYETLEMKFDSEDDIRKWMLKRQLGKRNLTTFSKIESYLKLYNTKKSDIDFNAKMYIIQSECDISQTLILYTAIILESGDNNIIALCKEGKLTITTAYKMLRVDTISKREAKATAAKIVRNKKLSNEEKETFVKKLNTVMPVLKKTDCLSYLQNKNNEVDFNLVISDTSNYSPDKLKELCSLLSKRSNENAEFYFFCDFKNHREYQNVIEKHLKIEALIVWDFDTSIASKISSNYRSRYQFIIYATKGYIKHSKVAEDIINADKKREVIDDILDVSNNRELKVLLVCKNDTAVINSCIERNIEVIVFEKDIPANSTTSLKSKTFAKEEGKK